MLAAVPDLRPTLKAAGPEELADLFESFDVAAVYDKPNRTLELSATVTPELVPENEEPRPSGPRYMLAEPGTRFARGQGQAKGRIMDALGDMRPADIETADVAAVLTQIAGDGVSRATVNRYREVIVAALNFALRPEQRRTWGLAETRPSGRPSAAPSRQAASRSSPSSSGSHRPGCGRRHLAYRSRV